MAIPHPPRGDDAGNSASHLVPVGDLGEFGDKQELPTYPNLVASFSACKCV
jgi:hypothetical protein